MRSTCPRTTRPTLPFTGSRARTWTSSSTPTTTKQRAFRECSTTPGSTSQSTSTSDNSATQRRYSPRSSTTPAQRPVTSWSSRRSQEHHHHASSRTTDMPQGPDHSPAAGPTHPMAHTRPTMTQSTSPGTWTQTATGSSPEWSALGTTTSTGTRSPYQHTTECGQCWSGQRASTASSTTPSKGTYPSPST